MLISKNVSLTRQRGVSAWRKVAVGAWRHPAHASIYATLDIDARPILNKIAELKAKGITISSTAIVGKGTAVAIKNYPLINSMIRFGRIYTRNNIDIYFQVSAGQYLEDVSGLTIRNCEKATLEEIAANIRELSVKIRKRQDPDFSKKRFLAKILPGFLVRPFLAAVSFVLYTLNLYVPVFHEHDNFGSAMVTSLGMFGIQSAYVPLLAFTRCPMIVATGAIFDKPVVKDGQITIQPTMQITTTLDHRFVDGAGAAKLMKAFLRYLANPY